jgi:hypothetical protein
MKFLKAKRALNAAFVILVASAPSACSKRSEEIEPASISATEFAGMTCSQLVSEQARKTRALIFAELAQERINKDDRIRTFGVPTPMGSLFNEESAESISRLKGQLASIRARLAQECDPDYG